MQTCTIFLKLLPVKQYFEIKGGFAELCPQVHIGEHATDGVAQGGAFVCFIDYEVEQPGVPGKALQCGAHAELIAQPLVEYIIVCRLEEGCCVVVFFGGLLYGCCCEHPAIEGVAYAFSAEWVYEAGGIAGEHKVIA